MADLVRGGSDSATQFALSGLAVGHGDAWHSARFGVCSVGDGRAVAEKQRRQNCSRLSSHTRTCIVRTDGSQHPQRGCFARTATAAHVGKYGTAQNSFVRKRRCVRLPPGGSLTHPVFGIEGPSGS